jgi:hypothetical protein
MNALRMTRADVMPDVGGQILGLEDVGPQSVVQIVVQVGDDIRQPDGLSFKGGRFLSGLPLNGMTPPLGVLDDALPNLHGQIQAPSVVFEQIRDSQTLLVVVEPAGHDLIEYTFPSMTEGRVSEVVPQGDGLDQIFVESESPSNRPGDLRYFQGMG